MYLAIQTFDSPPLIFNNQSNPPLTNDPNNLQQLADLIQEVYQPQSVLSPSQIQNLHKKIKTALANPSKPQPFALNPQVKLIITLHEENF